MHFPAPAKPAFAPINDVSHETRRIEMAAVICIGCHQPASLDESKRCFHCRLVPTARTLERIQNSKARNQHGG